MNRFRDFIAIMVFFFIFPAASFSGERTKTIVVFFPFNASLPAYQNFLETFQNTIAEDTEDPDNLMIEYLDIGRSTDQAYVKHIVELYNEKLKGTRIDLFVTVAPYTYSLLKKYGLEALENTPAIKIELDPPVESPSPFIVQHNIIEIKLKFRISDTFDYAFKLFPDKKEVYVISGSTGTDQYFTRLCRQGASVYGKSHHFNFISGIFLDSIVKIVRNIPPTGMVFIPIFLSDNKNNPFTTPEAIRMISANCRAPVFPIFDSFIKTRGGIGGYIFSYLAVGREAGRIAREILKGVHPGEIKVNYSSFYQYIFDWRQLEKWHLTGSESIPSTAIFYNKEPDFIREHFWEILLLALIIISETYLIFYLVKLNRRQSVINRQKLETDNLHREIMRQDRLITLSELTASLSHELNQPLTAILYSAQAGKRFLDSEKLHPDQAREIFENIIDDDKRAAGLISSVRSMMKIETREQEPVNLYAVIQDTLNIFRSEAVRQNIRIEQQLSGDHVFVFGDKIQLQQVVLNLLTNAGIAMEHKAPDQRILEMNLEVDQKSVVVSICDSGPGIDPDIKEKIFKPFVTSHDSGFGIGLAVSRSIIENHNGMIWADNIPGRGAKFSFRLQLLKDE